MKWSVRTTAASGSATAAALQRAQAGQQLAHVERLGDVVVGSGVQRADLVLAVDAGREHQHRPGEPRAQAGEHLGAVQVGQAQVEDDDVGMRRGGLAQRGATVGGRDHLVAGRAEGDPQGAGQLRVVVDDQDPAHDVGTASGCRRRDGRRPQRDHHRQAPTRGVLRGQGAVHRLRQTAGHGEPEADALTGGRVAQPLEGREDPLAVGEGNTWTSVDHAQLRVGRRARRPSRSSGRPVRGVPRCPPGWRSRARAVPGSAQDGRQVGRPLQMRPGRARLRPARSAPGARPPGGRRRSGPGGPRPPAAGSCPAGSPPGR